MSDQGPGGRVYVVTGANAGIGRAMSAQLGATGATVVMVNRNPERTAEALAWLRQQAPAGTYAHVLADLSELSQVRRAADEVRARFPVIHALLNNAGLYLPKRRLTSEGLEFMFAVNHLAPFLLTQLLLEPLRAAGPGRVVTTSSFGHKLGHVDFDDLQAERGFSGLRQYSNTKLHNVLFTRELARRHGGDGLRAHCFHPGMVATEFAQDEGGLFSLGVRLVRPFQRTAQKAARTGSYLATSDDALKSNGEYWVDARRKKPSRAARSDEVAVRLWDVSAKLCGLPT